MSNLNSNWFENWFDSPYYPKLYAHRNLGEAQDFIKRLFQFLSLPKKNKVIDVACGRGRHSIQVNSLGYEVCGIDLSAESIQEAKSHENDRLRFFVHDMRETFSAASFDLSLNLFTSFGYFLHEGDNVKAIEAMCSNLKSGGAFVLDYLNTERAVSFLPIEEIIEREGISFHINKQVEGEFIVKHITFTDNQKDYHFKEYVKCISKTDFENYLGGFDLQIMHIFGDYQLNPFDKANSERLIIIAKKK